MHRHPKAFPTPQQLKQGAILHTVAHAVFLIETLTLAHEVSWDGMNLGLQNTQGGRGEITFSPQGIVGAFFAGPGDERSPYRTHLELNWKAYFSGAPTKIRELAEKVTVQYLIDDYQGQHVPIITTAFWEVDGVLHSNDDWALFTKHSACLIQKAVLPFDRALDAFAEDYGFSKHQVELVTALFAKIQYHWEQGISLDKIGMKTLFAGQTGNVDEALALLTSIGLLR